MLKIPLHDKPARKFVTEPEQLDSCLPIDVVDPQHVIIVLPIVIASLCHFLHPLVTAKLVEIVHE